LRSGEVPKIPQTFQSNNVAHFEAGLGMTGCGTAHFLGKSTWHLKAFAHPENPLTPMVFETDE